MVSNAKHNPRRPPADKSVSLLHSPRARLQLQQRQKRNSDSSNEETKIPAAAKIAGLTKSDSNSPSSLNPRAGKHSSGESSNAEKWFEKSNNEVADGSRQGFADNDSPFFMRNSSSSEEQTDGLRSALQHFSSNNVASSLQMRTGLLHLGTDASSTEDFRSVIDDLTIENKKLKRRLKKYEKLHDSHMKDERLFEVRVHGLPPDKKRELEETLKKFAIELGTSRGSNELSSNGFGGQPPALALHKTGSSATSNNNTDSAYASMSVSGQGSASGENHRYHKTAANLAMSRHQNIHTYLHHIPEGLLPQQNPEEMTERAKKKLVVRRLEQIFAGKGAAVGGHQQALQQQDVSQSAARADRAEREAQGQQHNNEGVREASIMDESKQETKAQAFDETKQSGDNVSTVSNSRTGPLSSNKRSLDQRPTRPLDLDPHRAQVPAENLRYIRHLGFSLPEPGMRSPQDDEGWIYLNLLVSMAQLHTVSVSSDFVRKAIGEFSDRFELSADGRKVRWKGGRSVTRTSSNGGMSSIEHTDGEGSQSPRKRVKLGHDLRVRDETDSPRYSRSLRPQQSETNRFAYTPLFFHRDSTGDEDSSSETDVDDDGSSQFPLPVGGDSSGMTSSNIRTTSALPKKKHDDGPIIFYNNARFCTDLSGDTRPVSSPGAPIYKAANVAPLGAPQLKVQTTSLEKRGPLAEVTTLPEAMDLSDSLTQQSWELTFPPQSSPAGKPAVPAAQVDFEVTGIGGVYPADHFEISVESRHVTMPEEQPITTAQFVKALPPRLGKLFGNRDAGSMTSLAGSSRKFTATRKDMPPSILPPALSYMLTGSDSLSDDGSEADDNMSIAEPLSSLPRLAAPQQFDLPLGEFGDSDADMDHDERGDDHEAADAEDDDDDDGSVDLLAVARKLDPEAVRSREREYDANMAERLAEEIPTGSSAATAGGGSGFVSPSSNVSRAMYRQAMNEARAQWPAISERDTISSMRIGSTSSNNDG